MEPSSREPDPAGHTTMTVELDAAAPLRFPGGVAVRAASAIVALGDGWLVAQDDGTHGCLVGTDQSTSRVRLLPPVQGHDVFDEASGTKQLKPDLEAACALPGDLGGGVLLLGSGSTHRRRRGVRVQPDLGIDVVDLAASYELVARALGLADDELNLEGACIVDGWLRWFQRRPAASVDVALPDLDRVGSVHHYDLGTVDDVALGITDAVTVPGGILIAAAAEDSPNAYDDGPVVASALVLLPDVGPPVVSVLPLVDERVAKVEGLAVLDWSPTGGRVLAVVDADDPDRPSLLLTITVELGPG